MEGCLPGLSFFGEELKKGCHPGIGCVDFGVGANPPDLRVPHNAYASGKTAKRLINSD